MSRNKQGVETRKEMDPQAARQQMQEARGREQAARIRGWIVRGIAGLFLVSVGCSSYHNVQTGSVGVVTRFGGITGAILPEGFNLKYPWDAVHEMSVRTQQLGEEGSVPSSEMLLLHMATTLQFHLNRNAAARVYQSLGSEYVKAYVEPNFISAVRESTSEHKAADLFSAQRDVISVHVAERLQNYFSARGIEVERVLLRGIDPPPTVKDAIEQKQKAQQEAEAMAYRLQKETQEAQRKRIEAQGIKDFQDIVRQGIDEKLLSWKGIEATEMLAKSANTKIIVIGNSRGLPLILGDTK
jgi:regulator of protease activity HflC (stomatin/prohibitin superfamily)